MRSILVRAADQPCEPGQAPFPCFPSQTLIFSLQPLSTSSRGFVRSISSTIPVVLLGVSIMATGMQGIIRDVISTVKPKLCGFSHSPLKQDGLSVWCDL